MVVGLLDDILCIFFLERRFVREEEGEGVDQVGRGFGTLD